jgi:multiple sugar transport system substrate-binding protein
VNKHLRATLQLISISSVLLAGTGCSFDSISKKEVSLQKSDAIVLKVFWWGNQGRQERTIKAIKLFESKYPNIKIEPQDVPNSDYWIQIAMQTADQQMPDVIQMDYKYINEFAIRKLIMPLEPFIKSASLHVEDMDEASLASGKIDNQLYGVVTGINAPAFAYDPAIFEKTGVPVPKEGYTYEDLIDTSRKLKAKINQKDFYPVGSSSLDFGYYLRSRGSSYYNKDGTALGYDKDEFFSDFLKMEKLLVKEGLMATSEVLKNISVEKDSLLVTGRAAFHYMTSNNVITYNQAGNRPFKLIPLPGYPGGKEGNYVKPAMYFSISAYSKQSEAAAKFVDFFLNDLAANDGLQGERGVPAPAKVREHLMSKLNAGDKEQYDYMGYVQKHASSIDPSVPVAANKVSSLFTTLRQQVIADQITPEEAAKQFREGTNVIFKEFSA